MTKLGFGPLRAVMKPHGYELLESDFSEKSPRPQFRVFHFEKAERFYLYGKRIDQCSNAEKQFIKQMQINGQIPCTLTVLETQVVINDLSATLEETPLIKIAIPKGVHVPCFHVCPKCANSWYGKPDAKECTKCKTRLPLRVTELQTVTRKE